MVRNPVSEAGDIIPADGEVIEGIASVDESAITGESAPVIREAAATAAPSPAARASFPTGWSCASPAIPARLPGPDDRLVEGAKRQKTPNEIALNILLAALTIIFLVGASRCCPSRSTACRWRGRARRSRSPVLVALLVCLIPTTIGGCSRPSALPAWTA
jgi:K+-transporting ATPase ATPase B chain